MANVDFEKESDFPGFLSRHSETLKSLRLINVSMSYNSWPRFFSCIEQLPKLQCFQLLGTHLTYRLHASSFNLILDKPSHMDGNVFVIGNDHNSATLRERVVGWISRHGPSPFVELALEGTISRLVLMGCRYRFNLNSHMILQIDQDDDGTYETVLYQVSVHFLIPVSFCKRWDCQDVMLT